MSSSLRIVRRITLRSSLVYTTWIFPSRVCTALGYASPPGPFAMSRRLGQLFPPSSESATVKGIRSLMLGLYTSNSRPLSSRRRSRSGRMGA